MAFNLVYRSQQDPQWKNDTLGFATDPKETIGYVGCALTSGVTEALQRPGDRDGRDGRPGRVEHRDRDRCHVRPGLLDGFRDTTRTDPVELRGE